MRICMMNDHYYRSSGAAIAVKRIAQAMPNVGVDYYVAGCDSEGYPEDLSWVPAGRYERFRIKSNNPALVLRELMRFKRWFKAQRCQLVHCHHRRVSVLLQLVGIPVLYTGQLVFPSALWFRLLHPRKMTAISPSVAENLRETTGNVPIACVSNPVEFPDVVPCVELERVRVKAVCVARLEPVKGHVYLLAAWKRLRDRGHRYELSLVGEGSLRSQLEEQTVRDGTRELIRFHGYTDKVSDLIDQSLFAILVSEREGQGIVTLEAAARGRASLLTAVPGSVDLLPPDRKLTNGIEYGNVESLADALEEWFRSVDETAEEGRRFFRFLRSSSDPRAIALKYRAVYQKVLNPAG